MATAAPVLSDDALVELVSVIKGADSVVKLRPVVPSDLPDDVRESRVCMVEVDAMPGGYVCSASLKGLPGTAVQDAAGSEPLRKLFSKQLRSR